MVADMGEEWSPFPKPGPYGPGSLLLGHSAFSGPLLVGHLQEDFPQSRRILGEGHEFRPMLPPRPHLHEVFLPPGLRTQLLCDTPNNTRANSFPVALA